MKQAGLLALMISLAVLCGCSKSAKYEGMYTDWREGWLAAAEHQIEAKVVASDDEKVCEYTLLYTVNAEGETVEVRSPELIADIKAHIMEDEAQLSYDGAMLDTGGTLTEKLSPLMALPALMDVVREGHLENSWSEKKDGIILAVTELEMPDGTVMTLWQRSSDMTPVYADVRSGERVQIKITITKFDDIEV